MVSKTKKAFITGITIGTLAGFFFGSLRTQQSSLEKSEYDAPEESMRVSITRRSAFESYKMFHNRYKNLNTPELAVLLSQYRCLRRDMAKGIEVYINGNEFDNNWNYLMDDTVKTIVNYFRIKRGDEDYLEIGVDKGTYNITGTPADVEFKGDISAVVHPIKNGIYVGMKNSNVFISGMNVEEIDLYKKDKHYYGLIKGIKDGKKEEIEHRLTGSKTVSNVKTMLKTLW